MAALCRRIYFKYLKCIVLTVVAAFFLQISIAVFFFPSENDSILKKVLEPLPRLNDGVTAKQLSESLLHNDNMFSKSKTEIKAGSHLRSEELDFMPMCEITSREAISAIHRAKSQMCKLELVNKTCLIQNNMFYPKELPNYCLSESNKFGNYLGCYVDEKKKRLLSSFYGDYGSTNSPDACLEICVQAGLPYAGVQYATECFCGLSRPPASAITSDSSCDMICPGEHTKTCGGYFTMNVYETGLNRFTPLVPKTGSGENGPVRIVFLLTLNGRALRQVHRLINVLYKTDYYFYIHVDSRQDYMHRKLIALEKRFPNIKLAPKRFSTIWGGATLLQMLLTSMQDLLTHNWKWDYVINLSESDFPIKSVGTLEQFLSANKGSNFVKSHGREVQRFIKKQGLDKTFIECDTHMWRVGDRKLPRGIVIDGGSDWIALSHQFVKYAIGKNDSLLQGLDVIFQHTLLPAESYFHTVLRNSKFCNSYVDNNLHATNWKRKLGCKCQYKHVVDWCGCSPNDFKTEDWPRIQSTQSRQLFFARKFEPIVSQEILTRIEEYIGISDHHLISNLESYWQNIYDVNDLTESTDDTLLTHAGTIIRHNAKLLMEKGCYIEPSDILEINSYHYADLYKGNLILHKALLQKGEEVTLETWYKPRKTLEINFESQYAYNVKMFKVSSDYDQKEQMFRNLANILGPLSEPTLLYQFSPFDNNVDNLTIVWLDPAGVVAETSDIQVYESNLTNFLKPNLKTPLLPGIWKVGLFESSNIIAVTKFLITPLEFFLGKKLSNLEAGIIHGGSQNSYKNVTISVTSNFFPSQEEISLLKKVSLYNEKRLNKDLTDWIYNLSLSFYSILSSCLKTSNIKSCGKHMFEYCHNSDWSSLSPDPKGTVGKLNQITGKLDRV